MSVTQDVRVVRGACPHDCPDTCAMLVTVENGTATKVRGDPDHPFTQGGLCVKVNDYTNHTYSPDRVLHPLRRVGPKGEGRFERITWDEALDEYGSQAILPYSYLGTEGILNGLTVGDPFFHALGATISERTFCDSGSCTAYVMTMGATAGIDPESFVHSRYIVLWACNVRSTNLHMWPFIKEAQERGAKVVVIDPLRHRTAQAADWYIPIRPGTDGALALAMMHVIVNEGLVDKEYVDAHTVGYAELAERVQQYPPDWASKVTSRPRTSSPWPGSSPSASPRPSASGWRWSATPAGARPYARSPACPPWWGPGATSAAGYSSYPCGPSRGSGAPCTGQSSSARAPGCSTSGSWGRPSPASWASTRPSRRCSSTTPTRSSSHPTRPRRWLGWPGRTSSPW